MNQKVTDNFFVDFPARMSDGRQFTDYRPNCLMNKSKVPLNEQYDKLDSVISNTELASNYQSLEDVKEIYDNGDK